MDLKVLFSTFVTIFLAELGDKTQLATLAFSAETKSRISVFLGSAGALILTSLLGVLLGAAISRFIPPNLLKMGAGVLFVILGIWMILFLGSK